MFFEALYFGHLLSFYTMQLEPPKSEIKAHAKLLYKITNTVQFNSIQFKANLRELYHNVSKINLNDKSSSTSQYTNNTFTHIQCSIPACTANLFLILIIPCNSDA